MMVETKKKKTKTHPKILTSETIKKIKNFLIIQTNDELWEFIFHRDSTQSEMKLKFFVLRAFFPSVGLVAGSDSTEDVSPGPGLRRVLAFGKGKWVMRREFMNSQLVMSFDRCWLKCEGAAHTQLIVYLCARLLVLIAQFYFWLG